MHEFISHDIFGWGYENYTKTRIGPNKDEKMKIRNWKVVMQLHAYLRSFNQ